MLAWIQKETKTTREATDPQPQTSSNVCEQPANAGGGVSDTGCR